MSVSFDLFGTLVAVDRPADPAGALARELRTREVPVPDDWTGVYTSAHVDAPEGADVPLADHVAAALERCGVDAPAEAVDQAVRAAFTPATVRPRPGADRVLAAARAHGPVGVLSNCSVPGLVDRSLARAGLDGSLDAVVASVDCGWRKPDARAFDALAAELGVDPGDLVFVGDDPRTDGGVETVGGRFVDVSTVALEELAGRVESDGLDAVDDRTAAASGPAASGDSRCR